MQNVQDGRPWPLAQMVANLGCFGYCCLCKLLRVLKNIQRLFGKEVIFGILVVSEVFWQAGKRWFYLMWSRGDL